MLVGSFPNAQKRYSLSYRTTLISCVEELAFGIEGIKLANQVFIHDFSNLHELTKKVQALHKVDPFAGVLAFSEEGLIPASSIATHLNIPGIELQPVRKTCNKYLMREALDSTPDINLRYSLCLSPMDVREFYKTIKSPIVLKPLTGFGSRGVIFVNSLADIERAFSYSVQYSESILAEEFVKGVEFSVETFTYKGEHQILAITDKLNTGPPYFVGTSHSLPSIKTVEYQEMIKHAVKKLLDCINLTFGPAHTEVTVTENGVKIIESQIRPGGRIYHMLEGALGIDIFELTVKKMFGENYVPKDGKGGAAIIFIEAKPGVINEIIGVEEILKDPSVYDFSLRCKVGDKVDIWNNSTNRLGHLICIGNTTDEAVKSAKKLASKLKINTN